MEINGCSMAKRGQGHALWIIIFAVIALIALVVLVAIFTQTTTKVQRGLLDCSSQGGKCITESRQCPLDVPVESTVFSCPSGERCCLKAEDVA
jgi:hypothetical protein